MVFNLYLNAVRPHARRRFAVTGIARISSERKYVSSPCALTVKEMPLYYRAYY